MNNMSVYFLYIYCNQKYTLTHLKPLTSPCPNIYSHHYAVVDMFPATRRRQLNSILDTSQLE